MKTTFKANFDLLKKYIPMYSTLHRLIARLIFIKNGFDNKSGFRSFIIN